MEPKERVGEWGFSVDLENKQYPLVITERRLRYKGFECHAVVCRDHVKSLECGLSRARRALRNWICFLYVSILRSHSINLNQISHLRAMFSHTRYGVRLGQALALRKDAVPPGYAGVVRMKRY